MDVAEDEEAARQPGVEAGGLDDAHEGIYETVAIDIGRGEGVGWVRQTPSVGRGTVGEGQQGQRVGLHIERECLSLHHIKTISNNKKE